MNNVCRSWKIKALFFFAIIVCLHANVVSAQSTLYGIDNEIPFLSAIDPTTGVEISFVEIVVPNETYNSGNGLAVNPITNQMYGAVKLAGQSGPGRNLILIDPATGAATNIGNMGQPIASMAFSSSGVLYGVSGDCLNGCGGVAIAETLFTIDTTTAALTQVQTLGNGGEGEAIAFNPADGMMYHMSGKGAGLILEKINELQISPLIKDVCMSMYLDNLLNRYKPAKLLDMTMEKVIKANKQI